LPHPQPDEVCVAEADPLAQPVDLAGAGEPGAVFTLDLGAGRQPPRQVAQYLGIGAQRYLVL
jgi:hypothetical protein